MTEVQTCALPILFLPTNVFSNSSNTVMLIVVSNTQFSVSVKHKSDTSFSTFVGGGTPVVQLILKIYGLKL